MVTVLSTHIIGCSHALVALPCNRFASKTIGDFGLINNTIGKCIGAVFCSSLSIVMKLLSLDWVYLVQFLTFCTTLLPPCHSFPLCCHLPYLSTAATMHESHIGASLLLFGAGEVSLCPLHHLFHILLLVTSHFHSTNATFPSVYCLPFITQIHNIILTHIWSVSCTEGA